MTNNNDTIWYYESDGDPHNRTFYAYRNNPKFPIDVERIDFPNAQTAKQFVHEQNNLLRI